MAAPGWYQDPDGPPGQYRWWDGSAWTSRTGSDPSLPEPQQPQPQRGRRAVPLLALGAIIVVAAVVVGFVWTQRQPPIVPPGGTAAPTSTASSWNELPGDNPTSPPPSPTSTPKGLVACNKSSHEKDQPTAQTDGRMASGKLSVAEIDGWDSQWASLPSAYDVTSQGVMAYPNWVNYSSIGQLSKDDGFTDPATAAEHVMDCLARSDYYVGFQSRENLESQAVTVDGRPGWRMRANVYANDPAAPQAKGDVVDVTVVDPGGNSLGVYMGSCTIGKDDLCAQVRKAVETLKVAA